MNYEDRLEKFQIAKFHEASGNMTAANAAYDLLINSADLSLTSTKEDREITYNAYHRKLITNLQNRGMAMSLAPVMIEAFHKDKDLEERVLFDVAQAYLRMNETEAAFELLVKFQQTFPRSKQFAEASFDLGRIHHKSNKPAEAIPHYLAFLNRTKGNKRVGASMLSDCYLAIGDLKGARLVLEQYTGVTKEEIEGR